MSLAAAGKRRHDVSFGDESEDQGSAEEVTIAQGSSSLRSESRKRARVSLTNGSSKSRARQTNLEAENADEEEDDGAYEDEDEAMRDDSEGPSSPARPTATQYQILRDDGFKHLQHADEDDKRATQRLHNRPSLIGDNHAADNAVLESIECVNFMCHERLTVELGPLLNFIVGENGSGKSAVLTAITLCLGGKASSTNRGASLRSFIKEGQEHANLMVRIKNQGSDAYRPELYGDCIRVERHFTKSGSSGFKLKSETGRVISNKKADVDDVVEYFCLQVDNPLNVLSQDNARQFLNAATPAAKYKFFLQGTQLEQLDTDLQVFHEMLDQNDAKLFEYEESIAELKDQFRRAQQLKETADRHHEWRLRSRVYIQQLAWGQVGEQEAVLEEKCRAIDTATAEITRHQAMVDEKSDALEGHDQRIASAIEELEVVKQEEEPLMAIQNDADEKYKTAKAALETLHTQQRGVNEALKHAADTAKKFEKTIADEEERLNEINGGAVAEKQQKLEDAKQALQDTKTKLDDHRNALADLQKSLDDANRELQKTSELVAEKKNELGVAETRLQTLSHNKTDPMACYETQVPRLLKLIEQDGEYSVKPIGPLGSFIQLTKPEWSMIIETVCGGTLSAFLVASKRDQARLSDQMARLGIQHCPINIRDPNHRLKSLNEPDGRFETILRVLKFDDQRVRDILVIQNGIDQVVLTPTRVEAEAVMFDGPNDRPPRFVASTISHHDKRKGFGLRITNREGNLQTAPVRPDFAKKARIRTDDESQIASQEEFVAQLQSDLRELVIRKENQQETVNNCKQALTQHRRHLDSLDKDHRNAGALVSQVDGELDEYEGTDAKLQGLKEELQKAREKQEHYGQQLGDLVLEKETQSRAVEDLRASLKAAKEDLGKISGRIAKAEEKVRRCESLRLLALTEKNDAHHDLAMAKVAKDQAEHHRNRQQEIVEEHIRGATEIAPERAYVPEGESIQSIERKLQDVREALKKFREQHGADAKEINDRWIAAKEEFDNAMSTRENLTSLNAELKEAWSNRLDKWRLFQRMISAQARTNFGYLLSERGFRGRLLLDHSAKKLEIRVEPDQTRKNVSGRNTKTLSGGEKSFSSICLLLAIWDAMGSPLRCLDEFDVFMDNVNRAISTNMLIQAARRSVGKQFILITPNAIEGRAQLDKDVTIIRLTDPRQRQITDY